ncbi:MAG: 4-amino-4-deoxychorismate lyase [Alkalicoccus sp.]|nr:MAG: 4-amino-4-deoxychorismate lyase [Alkalicoccus sp.]
MYLYVNGEIVPDHAAVISPYEHGFLYGAGLFETFRTYGGRPFLLKDHLTRLRQGAEEYGLCLPDDLEDEVIRAVAELLKANELKEGYFRLNVSGGAEGIGLTAEVYENPRIIIYVKPLPVVQKEEKKLQTLKVRRNTPEGSVRRKSHHYMNNILAKRETGASGDVEGLFLTENNRLSEGTVSNLFFIKQKTIHTPDASCSCLPGVTARFVLELASALGYQVKEGSFHPKNMRNADEIFVTNSIQEIVPVFLWDDRTFPGKEGRITCELQSAYRRAVQSAKKQQGEQGETSNE